MYRVHMVLWDEQNLIKLSFLLHLALELTCDYILLCAGTVVSASLYGQSQFHTK
jgi:hypothetical protein